MEANGTRFRKQSEITKIALNSERPYLIAAEAGFAFDTLELMAGGNVWFGPISIKFINYGKGPAIVTQISGAYDLIPTEESRSHEAHDYDDCRPVGVSNVVLPNGPEPLVVEVFDKIDLDREDLDSFVVRYGEDIPDIASNFTAMIKEPMSSHRLPERFYVFGKAEYTDVFDQPFESIFCLRVMFYEQSERDEDDWVKIKTKSVIGPREHNRQVKKAENPRINWRRFWTKS